MSTENTGATPDPEDAGATPDNPNPNDPGATPANGSPDPKLETPSGGDQPKTPEELQAEITRLNAQLSTVNRESAERRRKLAALEAEQQKLKDAELSEAQREKKRADEAEQRANAQSEQLRRYSVLDATRAAAQKQSLALNEAALQDAYAAGAFKDIELDDSGVPQGVDAHLKELVKTRPYLLQNQVQAPDVKARNGGKSDEIISDDEYASTARSFGLRVPRRNS